MLEELERYFSGAGFYNWGVRLLRQLGHDSAACVGFEKYCSLDFAPLSIEWALKGILKGYYENLKAEMSLISDISEKKEGKNLLISKVAESPTPSVEPSIITNLRREERQCRDDRRALHLTLDDTPDDVERSEKCFSIRALTRRIDEIWNIIFAFERDGSLPALGSMGEEKTATEEVLELTKRQLTLRPRLTRLKQMLADVDLAASKKLRYEREQKEKEAELEGIVQKLSTVSK